MLFAALLVLSFALVGSFWFLPLHVTALAFIVNFVGYAEWDCLRATRDSCALRTLFESAIFAGVLARATRAVVLECSLRTLWPPGILQTILRGIAIAAAFALGNSLLIAPLIAGVVVLKAVVLDRLALLGLVWIAVVAALEVFELYIFATAGAVCALAVFVYFERARKHRARHERQQRR